MANENDDILTGPVPEPDAEPTAAERAHAKTFADLVEKTLAGRTPPAMSADDRALLEVATVIRAASGNVQLPPSKQRSAIEDALRQKVGAAGGSGGIVPLASRRSRVPWAIAAVSAVVAIAAVLLLWLRAPAQTVAPVAARVEWTSRPADPLIGPIARDHDADASTRIDTIFADRLDGYRERRLERGRKP